MTNMSMKQTKNIDDDGNGVKPKYFLQRGMIYTSGCDLINQMCDKYGKIEREILVKKEKQLDLFILLGQNSVRLKAI